MSTVDTKNTTIAVSVCARYVRSVNGCVAGYSPVKIGGLTKSRERLQEATELAVNIMATDPNVYETVVTFSIVDRDREELAFPSTIGGYPADYTEDQWAEDNEVAS